MSPLLAVTMLICAIVGGIIGWRRASRPLSRRPHMESEARASVAEEEGRRRLHRRIRLTLIYALLGVVVGLFGLLLAKQRV